MRHTLSLADHGSVTDLAVGDELELQLPENATTGFRWQLEAPSLDLLEDRSERVRSNAVGGAGQRVFVLRARTAGDARVDAKLWRAWEGDASVQSRFSVTARVA